MLIEIEDKEAVDWLKVLISNQLNKMGNEYTITHLPILTAWQNALENPVERSSIAAEPKAPSTPRKGKKKTKKSPGRNPKDKPFECAKHPLYGGVRVPRTDCERCWEIYRSLHPMEYAQKRRAYELKANKG